MTFWRAHRYDRLLGENLTGRIEEVNKRKLIRIHRNLGMKAIVYHETALVCCVQFIISIYNHVL